MKRNFLALMPVMLALLTAAACRSGGATREPLCGGWSVAAVGDESVVAAARFAVAEQNKRVGEHEDGLELVKILEAEQQVVAGMNYRLRLLVKQSGRRKTAEAVVWWQSWREPNPYELVSWLWK